MMQVLQSGWDPIGQWPTFGTDKSGFFATGLADSATYVGGMPVGLIPTGFVVGGESGQIEVTVYDISTGLPTTGNQSNCIGLLYNNCVIDVRRGVGQKNIAYDIHDAIPTIVKFPTYAKLWKGQPGSTDFPMSHDVADDRAPFLSDAWAINDLIFIEQSATAADTGRLTRTAGAPNTSPIGRVYDIPADANDFMIAEFWEGPHLSAQP